MKQIISATVLIFVFCFAAFSQANENRCPQIDILTVNESGRMGEFVFFIAEVGKEIDKYEVKYNWTVKNVEIIQGQGMKVLQTFRKDDDVAYASLEIKGLPGNCENTVSEAIPAFDPPSSRLFDEFKEISQGDKKARMDNFFNTLRIDPSAKGLIIISNNKNSLNQMKFLSKYIEFKEFDKTRISFLITDEIINSTQLFVIPAGAYEPTYNNSFVIKAEDFNNIEDVFRPKPTTKKRKK